MGALHKCRRSFVFFFRHRHEFACLKYSTMTGNTKVDQAMDKLTGGKLDGWLMTYEEMVGLTEVRAAQEKVIQAEHKFLSVQTERRTKQILMSDINSKLKAIHAQLDKVQRGDERYLALLTEEYQVIKDEKCLETDLTNFETRERDLFAALSSAVRESHEKERSRTERTKYWSIIGSVIGAAIGIIGTSLNNYLRMRELRGIVKDSAAGGVQMKELVGDLSETMGKQHEQINAFVRDLKVITGSGKASNVATPSVGIPATQGDLTVEELQKQTKNIMNAIKEQDKALVNEMTDLRKLLAISKASDTEGNVVYVGPELESRIEKAENNIEWKIKSSALWTVTFIYGALAVTVPVLYTIFKGS